jgi:glycosyltransferase involved in cell wall biosynthesis
MKVISTTERPINLLQIIGAAVVGGMETYVLRLLERLPHDRFRVTCLCVSENHFTSQLRDLGCNVHVCPITDEPSWQSIQLGASLIRSEAIDVMQAHLPNAHSLAGILSKLTEVPALATIHGRYLHMRDFEVHKLTQTNISVVAKTAYYQALTLGVPSGKLKFIANGVDTEVFRPGPRSSYIHSLIGADPKAPLVGFVGRLSPEKGPEIFLQAASMVHKMHKLPKSCHFVLIGAGSMWDKLKHEIADLGLDNHVHLVGLQHDMAKTYSSLDLVVSTSFSEAMPLAILEAMASGLPVVATNVGGIPDMIAEGSTGLLSSVGDLNGLAWNISNLMSDESLRAAMGKAARKRAVEKFELNTCIDQTSELLMSLTQGGYRSERGEFKAGSSVP